MSRDCGHKGHEWYEDLKKHFLEWGKNNNKRWEQETSCFIGYSSDRGMF